MGIQIATAPRPIAYIIPTTFSLSFLSGKSCTYSAATKKWKYPKKKMRITPHGVASHQGYSQTNAPAEFKRTSKKLKNLETYLLRELK